MNIPEGSPEGRAQPLAHAAGSLAADDLLGGPCVWKLLQLVAGEVQGLEVDETPGHDRGQGRQAIRGQVQLGDSGREVHEPV